MIACNVNAKIDAFSSEKLLELCSTSKWIHDLTLKSIVVKILTFFYRYAVMNEMLKKNALIYIIFNEIEYSRWNCVVSWEKVWSLMIKDSSSKIILKITSCVRYIFRQVTF